MKANSSRKAKQGESWPRKVQPGRAIVTVYRRKNPSGNWGFLVANYADGEKRRLDAYPTESDALAAAETLAKRLDARDYVAAAMTREQAIEYANSVNRLAPFNVTVDEATSTVSDCLKILPDLDTVRAACRSYAVRHRKVIKKPVAELAQEFLQIKEARKMAPRYLKDLRVRLTRFADDCKKDAGNVSTADVQDWLDGQKLAAQNYKNFRVVLNTMFKFAVTRSYAADNPVEGVEKIQVPNGGKIEIFTPDEIAGLLKAAPTKFLPHILLGAFAGLRSSEIERLEWSDIDFASGFIRIEAGKAKTRSRRLVPIQPNLSQWLAAYARHRGQVWHGSEHELQDARAATVQASGVKWRDNGCRHSYISYRLAEIQDAAKVALEAGNSPNVVFKHYRELVRPADAVKWFSIKPEQPANVTTLAAATVNP
jgi:integrase